MATKPKLPITMLILACRFLYISSSLDNINMQNFKFRGHKVDEVAKTQTRQASQINCDITIGEWVYDHSYPLYESSCPYLSTEYNCKSNVRPDLNYEKWRWRPKNCLLPRFNALDFLERIRKKRVMLVGDSIMRNQWESLLCLVEAVIPSDRKLLSSTGPVTAFHAIDFEASIEFSWAPLLVELKDEENDQRVLHLDSIEQNAKYWVEVDFLVFDSAHWWTHTGQYRSWDLYKIGRRTFTDMNPIMAYEIGLTTWANWVDLNLDPNRTKVIFRSVSPRHNRDNGWQCYKKRVPSVYLGGTHRTPAQLVVLTEIVKKMSFPVYLMDITTMSGLRRDGHPSIFTGDPDIRGTRHGKSTFSDCSHWCLPGVPDTWNEVLSALL
ncbi:Protein trichome birefringence [Rhynchospora pubera]|uniref:Protein trichome birefringence n=1 Tax=Rhynchospora pubera TaxID=906938 RepID=A0AAV8HRP5_9POAL|nr:Protein trichome birefringence [Rhynchospora pubera]